jgi:hypothetical protein
MGENLRAEYALSQFKTDQKIARALRAPPPR